MNNQSRRRFLSDSGKTMLAASVIPVIHSTQSREMKNIFVHHVYFWLKNPSNQDDLKKLLAGLRKLSAVKTIQQFHIGQPAGTSRDVIDSSYSVSWLLIFASKEDQDSYQVDPVHLKFVEECKDLWSKVTVYDSVDAK